VLFLATVGAGLAPALSFWATARVAPTVIKNQDNAFLTQGAPLLLRITRIFNGKIRLKQSHHVK
jgi:hypothetical protein